MHREHTTTQA